MKKKVQPPNHLQQSLPIPCAVARQDAAPPEAGRKFLHKRCLASGGAASSRAGVDGTRPEAASPTAGRKWLLRGLLAVGAVVAGAGFAYWVWHDLISVLGLAWLVWLLLLVPGGLCGCLYWAGRRRTDAGRRGGRAMSGAALAGGALALAAFGYYLWVSGPWHNGIVLRGTAPDGGEYFLSQAWNDWFDGYDIRLFRRQADGQWLSLWGGYNWESYYRGNEINWSGRAPVIRLADGRERGFNHRPDLQTTHPAPLSPDDLHALHLAQERAERSIPGIWNILNGVDSEGGAQ